MRDHPGPRHARNGLLPHLFATDPWLGVLVIVAIILAALVLVLIKTTGRILTGTPWWVRLGLLAAAGVWISRRLSPDKRGTPSQDARDS